jgi:UDP-N-acetylmuramyl pentapeptide phosphotransferase/UDP-N-acetylglucosamine-1-phosphate transferase
MGKQAGETGMTTLVYLVVSFLAALLLIPFWAELMRLVRHLEVNYRGRTIPQSMGGVYPLVFLLAAAWANRTGLISSEFLIRMMIVTVGFGVLGLVDDIWGDGSDKGFGGHFRRFFSYGQVSTGLFKAVAGFLLSLWAVAGLPGFFLLIFWRALLVALAANMLNLLDLRPGRSLKLFFLLALLYAGLVSSETGILLLFPFLLGSLVYFPTEMAERGMLGDAGANVLGGALGLTVVLTAPAMFQVALFVFLLLMNILAERVSLTQLIAKTPLLHFFDYLGIKDGDK